jgi:integrase
MDRLSVSFQLRSKVSKGNTDVQCHITINGGKRLVYNTYKKVLAKDWTKKSSDKRAFRFFKSTMKGYHEANKDLLDFFQTVHSEFNRFCREHNRVPTNQELKHCLNVAFERTKRAERIDLFQFIERFIERRRKSMIAEGKRVSGNTTLTGYQQSLNLLKEFSKSTRTPLDFDLINLEMYEAYVEYMQDEKRYRPSNIGKHIKYLKTFMNDALELGFTKNRSHQSKYFRIIRSESFAIALNEEEVQAIHELDLSDNKGLDEQRDVFIVQCSTGLRFSDVSNLTRENIRTDSGKSYIQIKTQKTGEVVSIPIDARLSEILVKYKDTSNGFPRAFQNQVMNRYLKVLGQKVDLLHQYETINSTIGGKNVTEMKKRYELLTSHTGRRTFATKYYHLGVPPQVLMLITGHKSEAAFFKYIKTTSTDFAKVFELVVERSQLKVV